MGSDGRYPNFGPHESQSEQEVWPSHALIALTDRTHPRCPAEPRHTSAA